ncbi:hypothetical protein BX666DRAFT_2098000 [Dichotomocladium elegans]|nr:hypothetical protein BX666DRAFT_2098000 [Dichotomocladium elegans]
MFHTSSFHHHDKFILICCADTFVGHALAAYIATVLQHQPGMISKNWRVRALCERMEGMADLVSLNVDVQAQMKHVKSTVIVPGMTENQVSDAVNVIDAASKEGVKRVYMISMMGCDTADEDTPLGQFRKIEDHLRSVYAYGRWSVFRHTFLHNNFIFWTRMVEKNGELGMPMSSTTEFTTIDILDVCDAVTTVLLSPKKQDTDDGSAVEAIKRIYELTGPCTYTGDDAVNKLCKAIGAEEGTVKYKELELQNMRDYFEEIKKTHLPPLNTTVTANTTSPYVPDPQYHLEPVAIEVMLGWFVAATVSGVMGKVSNDARDLLGEPPRDIFAFFEEQRDNFRPPSGGDGDGDDIV